MSAAMRTLRRLAGWRPGRLAAGTMQGIGWQAVRILLQSANIVMLAHALGAGGYGALSGTVSLYTVIAQLVGVGTGVTLVRDVARQPEREAVRWQATLGVFVASGVLLFLLALPLANVLLRGQLEPAVLCVLAFSELVAAPLVIPSAYWLLARDRIGLCNAVLTAPAVARLGAAAAVLLAPGVGLKGYAGIYAALMALISLAVVTLLRPAGAARIAAGESLRTAKDGAPYIFGTLAATGNSEIDKTLLLRMFGPVVAGQYSAAFRVAQAATIPVNALMVALVPRLFRLSRERRYVLVAMQYLLVATAYGLLAAGACWVIAPYSGWLLGADFNASATALRFLSLYVVVNCMRRVVTDLLTAADRQWWRNGIEGGSMVFIIVANLLGMPHFGWRATAAAAICADLLVVLAGLELLRRAHAGRIRGT